MSGDNEVGATSRRIPIPQRMRFEIFKRDKFTCQYCGRRAPDVVLHCDHVHPVALGGGNDLLNLVTSCADCNGGKGKIPLSDGAALAHQVDILAELEERRQQIEMLVEWRKELQSLDVDAVSAVEARLVSRSKIGCSNEGRAIIARWVKRHGLEEVLAAADEALDMYLRWDGDAVVDDSWDLAFSKIPSLLSMRQQEVETPHIRRVLYIQGIIRKRSRMKRYNCVEYLKHIIDCGADIGDMERRAARMRTLEDFEGPYDAWLESIGKKF